MLAMIFTEQSKFEEAKIHLAELLEMAKEALPSEYTQSDRAAELYPLLIAGQKSELWDDAWALATKLREHERNLELRSTDSNWEPILNGANRHAYTLEEYPNWNRIKTNHTMASCPLYDAKHYQLDCVLLYGGCKKMD